MQENVTVKTNTSDFTTAKPVNIAAIVVPSVIGSILVILGIALFIFFCIIRKKRQTEGTYRPSSEEQTGARVQTSDALKLPKEERLI